MTQGHTGRADSWPGVAVIIVSADSGPLLETCIANVLASPLPQCVQLFDNASRDGVAQRIEQKHKDDARLHVACSSRNLGFGAAVNRAAKGLTSDWLLILNPDVLLPPADLERLMSIAASNDDAGLIGAVMVDQDGTVDPASRRRDPLLRRSLAQLGFGSGETVDDASPIPASMIEVEAVSGALMLVRRSLLRRIGGFDEQYFLHFEDLDLCRRVRDAGSRVLLAGELRVVHVQGSSSHHRPVFVAWHKHRGMWRWFRQHDPAARSWLASALVWPGIWLHFLVQLPAMLWSSPRADARAMPGA